MLTKKIIYISALIISLSTYAQEDSHLDIIENKLAVLSQTTPQLEEKIEVDLSNTSLSNFLKAVSKLHELNLNISPELNKITVINNFTNVKIIDLLYYLAKEYNLDYDFTGNIITISPYTPLETIPPPKEIRVQFNPGENTISLDLQDDSLQKVFRKITDVSGKNLLYAPGMENIALTTYMKDVSFPTAMEKLAMSNRLDLKKSEDGFYIFNRTGKAVEGAEVYHPIGAKDNFYFQVQDSINRLLKVDFKNVPSEEIILSVSKDLGVNIFIASDLSDMGSVTIKSESILYDTLLTKIFEGLKKNTSNPEQESSQIRNNLNSGPNNPTENNIQNDFYTYKKENDIYYFGTEDQLAVKSVEMITMHYRSIELLSNPSGDYNKRRQNRNLYMTGNTNYYGGNGYSNNAYSNQSREINNPRITNEESEDRKDAILDIVPEDIKQHLNINIDSELNSFIVSGPAERINRFKKFVNFIDKPVPVILIEVMILEVNKSATVETGLSFGIGEEPVKTMGQAFPATDMQLGAKTVNRIIGGFDGFGSLNIGKVLPDFYMNIKAMESNGNIKILSTPKLSTINGHKAHLSSGQTTYYAVTNQNFFGSQIPQTSEITNYYPIDAELALDIMPFVSGDGEITLDINVIQSNFNGERIAEEAPPGMNSREFSSIIRMRDQDVAILGGIEQRTKDDSGSGVPGLSRIPVLKWLFSSRKREDSKKKLNILIKPTVIY